LFVDGVLIPVGSLINGTTIKLYEARELAELEFFNIKLESHDVIYAKGAPVETLLEVDECAVNFSEYLRKYGAPRTDEARCAPIAPYGGRDELRSRVRSAISPCLDRREPIDMIRDQLEERAIALSRELAVTQSLTSFPAARPGDGYDHHVVVGEMGAPASCDHLVAPASSSASLLSSRSGWLKGARRQHHRLKNREDPSGILKARGFCIPRSQP
jgi:hypothetical protein